MAESEIAEWYGNQNIFVTGATGFMGKVLLEKILRSCPSVNAIYILIRPKKGNDSRYRLDELLKCPVFDNLRRQSDGNKLLAKIKCINGDITKKNCGLSADDMTLLNKSVTLVFHMAANVRFDQPLKSAVKMNTGGALNVLELACNFQKLTVFVHVSTSYCHCNVGLLEEKCYKSPHNPRKMLDLVEWMDEDLLDFLTPQLLKDYPNTYAYTKCLTEQLVSEFSHKLPVVITRPSIVTAAYKEPIPGWVDNINGPTGIMIGAGKGVIRTMHVNPKLLADVVPVDKVINSLIIIAWKESNNQRKNEVEVYHITANPDTMVSWGEALDLGKKYYFDYPFSIILWYPGGSPKSNYFVHSIATFFLHIIPAYIIDCLLIMTNHEPFMVKVQKRVQSGLKVMQYYTTKPWNFQNKKLFQTVPSLRSKDREIFYTDLEKTDQEEYMLNYIIGTRKYCAKDELDTLPQARRLLKRLYYLDVFKNLILLGLLLWISYRFFYYLLK